MLTPEGSTARGEALVGSSGLREWVVLLEAAADGDATFIDIGTLWAILKRMGDATGIGLHCPDRIAVQVRVRGIDPAMTLVTAMSRWHASAVSLLPRGWDLVRAEVLTLDEFKRDCAAG